jgi:hypothetical protein
MTGPEWGFEGCLTSRPFTSRTFVADRLGAILPGRSDAAAAERVRRDLADGLSTLKAFGFCHETRLPPVRSGDFQAGRVILIGPVRVDDRWCPSADHLVSGAAWRYLLVEHLARHGLICFDVVFGGYTGIPQSQLSLSGAEVVFVDPPPQSPDTVAVAQQCLYSGAVWRADEADCFDRNGAGLMRCAEMASALLVGGSARRLRLSLQTYALQTWRWSCLLGHARAADMDSLALADMLSDSTHVCRRAYKAVRERNDMELKKQLRQLATHADAITELSARRTTGES